MSAQTGADPAAHPPHLRPLAADDPASVGPYSLAGRLAEDAAGVVYAAADADGSPVAVRVAGERLAAGSGDGSVLARRIEALRGLAGVCALPVLAAETGGERPWLATAPPSGETLRTRVEDRGPLSDGALIALAAGTAEALTAAELAGVAYGVITPDDVVLAPDGPRILGLDAVGGAGGSGLAAAEGPAEGTERAAWAGPETADGAAPSAPGDVYSWGCLVAYTATGRHPFRSGAAADGPSDVRRRAREGNPDLSGVPTELAPLIELALATEPGARPTAESAYRGLVAYASTADTSQIATRDLGDRLRAALADGWSGVAARQQAPAAWSAASAQPSPTADPAEPTAPAQREDPDDRAASSSGRGAAEPPEDAAAEGASADAPAAGRPKALPTAIVTASSMTAAIAIGAAGFLIAGALAGDPAAPDTSPSPSSSFGTAEESVAEAAEALRTGESYRAIEDVEDVDGADAAERREYVLATPDGAPLFQSLTLLGDPEEPAVGSTARIYRPESDGVISRDFGGGSQGQYTAVQAPTDEDTAWGDSRAPVLGPFAALEDTMQVDERIEGDLNGTPALRVSGTFTVSADGTQHADAPFDLWSGTEGRPLRLKYTAGGTEHEWEFTGFGGLDSRICGVVDGVPDLERAYLVPTSGDIDCGDVRPTVQDFLAIPESEQQAAGYVAEVGEWTCRLLPAPDGSAQTRAYSADAGACYRGGIGSPERVDLVVMD